MSNDGPRLRRCPRGYAYAKFNGRKMHFGRYEDPVVSENWAGVD